MYVFKYLTANHCQSFALSGVHLPLHIPLTFLLVAKVRFKAYAIAQATPLHTSRPTQQQQTKRAFLAVVMEKNVPQITNSRQN
jgi:hypothetical protein